MFPPIKRGVSSYISVLMLLVVTIAGGVLIYSYTGTLASNSIGNSPYNPNLMVLDSSTISENTLTAYIRNAGKSTIIINSAYINSKPVTGTGYLFETNAPGLGDDEIHVGEVALITIQIPSGFQVATSYRVKLITRDNSKLEFRESTYIPQSETESSSYSWLGTGSDGELVVDNGDLIVNSYCYMVGDTSIGGTSLDVNDASEFNVGDEILVIQVQNSTNGKAGLFEFKQVSSVEGNTITVETVLENSYYSGVYDSIDAEVCQVVRVPNYSSVSIQSGSRVVAADWDGYIGGIVVLRVQGDLVIEAGASFDVSEQGFRGGAFGPSYNRDGTQGEGYLGSGIGGAGYGTGKMNNAGGGGSYICGGGGEYAGGASDSDPWSGSGDTYARKGDVYGSPDLSRLFFGSGGGGQWNGQDTYGPPSDGGDGGGIILVYAETIVASVDGFMACGETTFGVQRGSYTYGSSGGAGGSIYLCAVEVNAAPSFCRAVGGLGNHAPIRDGGDGGVGRIRIDSLDISGSTQPAHYPGQVPE